MSILMDISAIHCAFDVQNCSAQLNAEMSHGERFERCCNHHDSVVHSDAVSVMVHSVLPHSRWLAGAVLYDPRNTTTATEVQPVVNTVMGFRGHIQPRIGYKIQGLFLMPIFSDRDRLFDTDLQLGAGPVLTQVAANFGITYAF